MSATPYRQPAASRLPFGQDFLWGAATAAYQVEGAARLDGRGPSIWDVFLDTPGRSAFGETGEVACDQYHRYREDVALMRELNLRAYRFSVSWPRVQPLGRGRINTLGLDYYDSLVDSLLANNIQPLITLYHWDLPAALQMEMAGWANPDIANIFADYAEIIFKRLGDRARYWITLNEPWCSIDGGYFHGAHAPGIRDRALGYQAGHNLMRAHAYAVARFRASRPNPGMISFAVNTTYSEPANPTPEDRAAAERAMLNFAGWFTDPPHFGDYPKVMRERLGDLLPEFTAEDSRLLRRSMDYIALNYYFSDVARHKPGNGPFEFELVPQPHLPKTTMDWPITPDGFHKLLHWFHNRYDKLPIYITENGAAMDDKPDATGFVNDLDRMSYLYEHIDRLARAKREGVDIRGYFAWSLMDNLEWSLGYSKRFGIIRCDHTTQKRTIKASGRWYARLIDSGVLEPASSATADLVGAG